MPDAHTCPTRFDALDCSITMSCVRTRKSQQAASDLAAWVNSRGRDVLNFYDDCDVRGLQNMPIDNDEEGNISSVIVPCAAR